MHSTGPEAAHDSAPSPRSTPLRPAAALPESSRHEAPPVLSRCCDASALHSTGQLDAAAGCGAAQLGAWHSGAGGTAAGRRSMPEAVGDVELVEELAGGGYTCAYCMPTLTCAAQDRLPRCRAHCPFVSVIHAIERAVCVNCGVDV